MKIEVLISGNGKRYEAVIDPNKEYDLSFGLFGEGKTVKDCISDFYVSLDEMRATYIEDNKEFPNDLEFVFKYDTASFLQYYSTVFSFAALERLTGINQVQLSQYVRGYRRPSRRTTEKIEKRLRAFANELSAVQFA